MPNTRAECYDAIREVFTSALTSHYREFPEKLKEAKAVETATKGLLKLLNGILTVLDGYNLTRKV